jgi:hypothetical protein
LGRDRANGSAPERRPREDMQDDEEGSGGRALAVAAIG